MSEYDAAIVATKPDARAETYPTCDECGEPVVFLWVADSIGVTRLCSNDSCPEGLKAYAARQIPGSTVSRSIDAVGLDVLREQIPETLKDLNEYRAEHGLPEVDTDGNP